MQKISILMYHRVGRFQRPRSHRATYCDLGRFKRQMAWLAHCRYQVISLERALEALYGHHPLSGHGVVLTFDDGYLDFSTNVFPVLQRWSFPATVYLVAGLLGQHAEWLAREGRHAPRLLDVDQVRTMRRAGITFGSHTMTHPFLSHIDVASRKWEIMESKTILENLLEEEVTHFCYPDGDYNPAVVADVRAAGYRSAMSCIRGSAIPDDNPLLLPRKAISYGDSLIGYLWKIHMKHQKKAAPHTYRHSTREFL